MTLIKNDIIAAVAQSNGIGRNVAVKLVESILREVKATLQSGIAVHVRGFGRFSVRHKNARIGRNPKTKQEHEISERTVVTFTASKVFKKLLNE